MIEGKRHVFKLIPILWDNISTSFADFQRLVTVFTWKSVYNVLGFSKSSIPLKYKPLLNNLKLLDQRELLSLALSFSCKTLNEKSFRVCVCLYVCFLSLHDY